MSWLSTSLTENLTNITGQISTFTKDMLTEGTVEVDDHETELKIAKTRVRELELTLYTQREEYDRVKELNHELQEKAEAAELQISSISREYRTLLQEKENEVVQLREELETWKEHGSKRERLPSFNEDSFVDGTSQDEVEYLKAIVKKLQEEKLQWSKNDESENLHKELDHYQHELATLHTTYSQRIATLNKKHKQEIEELESFHHEDSLRIQELEEQLAELEKHGAKSQNIVLEKPADSESDFEIIKKESAESNLEALPNEQTTTSEEVSELKLQIDRLENENSELKEKVHNLEVEATENNSKIAVLEQERKDLTTELNKAIQMKDTDRNNTEIIQLKQEMKDLIEQRDQAVVSEAQTSASLESLREELSRLGAVTMELMKEVEQSQGVDKEKSIEIESLKKVCQVRKLSETDDHSDEIVKLKDMLAVLWQKYSSVVLENEKVRLDMMNIKRRLFNQVQNRHGDTKSIIDGLSETRTKLTNQIEGQKEGISLEKHQLISMIPGVENEVENHEECLSRLVEESDYNKEITKDIVNDFGRRWSVSNHVASLQAEKAVLERTIVGLEEKVQELEERLRNEDTSRVVSDDLRATPHLSEDDDLSSPVATLPSPESSEVLNEENGETTGEQNTTEYDDNNGGDYNEGVSNECTSKDYDNLIEKLREYEDMIQEFEMIKEDWEGEKEALENVVVQLRQKLKDTKVTEKNEKRDVKSVEKRYLNDIEELLIKKNFVSESDLNVSDDNSTREDVLLSRVLEWLRSSKMPEQSTEQQEIEESLILKQDNNQYYTSMVPNEDLFNDESEIRGENSEDKPSLLKHTDNKLLNEGVTDMKDNYNEELHTTENKLEETRSEHEKTKHELDTTKRELDETNTRLKEVKDELDKTRHENEKSRVELKEANERAEDLGSKLKLLEKDLENNQVNFNTTISEKGVEVHKLRNVVEQLQGTLSNFENDKANTVNQLKHEIETLEKELGSVTSSCETMTTRLEESKQELALVLEAKDTVVVQLKEMEKEKEQLLGMVNDRDTRIEELQDSYDLVNQRFSLLQEEGQGRLKAFSELNEENSLLKEEKSDVFSLLEAKENELNNSLRESEKLSELLREQELAGEEIKRQNIELAKDLENWRIQLEELNHTKDMLHRDLDAKSEEIMSLKENNIELANQSYDNSAEISQKLSMLEQLVSENLELKTENETLMEALSEIKISDKEMKDSYNLLVQEKKELDASFSKKSLEMDQEVRRKIDEVEVLRLEVVRLTKESHEKDNTIRVQASTNMMSSDDDVSAKQEHIRRIMVEKDVEIDALRTKNESLLTLFSENEQEKEKINEEHKNQITTMLKREERMFNEINEKNDQIIALEDRLEMLNIKSASKDQATALIHGEHQKLLHLNESQSEEIGRLREKVTNLGLLVSERDSNGEMQKIRQRNSDLQSQVDALQGEQERLLMLVHDKDKQLNLKKVQEAPLVRTEQLFVQNSGDEQLTNSLHEQYVNRTKEVLVNTPPSDNNLHNISENGHEMKKLVAENQTLAQEIMALRNNVKLLSDSIESERNINTSLARENEVINQRMTSLKATQVESGDKVKKLEIDGERLRQELSTKEKEILTSKEENNRKVYEINTLQNEKDELLLEHTSQVEELQNKLNSLLDVICNDVDLRDEQFEILESREDFERLVTRVKNHRARLLSDKESEVRLLKEQVETLNSVHNISNPQLEAKLEEFIHEKEVMNQKITDIENEKLELLELKENEMTSLQSQVVDLSNILKQKERQWLAEKDTFSEQNSLLEKRALILEQERDSMNENKVKSEIEISRLREEVVTLTASADQKLDVVSHEKDRRVKDLERELDGLKQRFSQSVHESQSMKNELETARKITEEFEFKKEKELERLRTHLLQVEDSYTQEALAAEERENELRNQLEQIHQQLLSSSHSLQDSNRTASMKMENLQEQLISITAHRDELQAQLEQSQEQTLQYIRSVENLQMVLEQFQREKESELKNLRERNREQLDENQKEITRLCERERDLQELLQNASEALNRADKFGEDLKLKENEIENLKQTVVNLESDLQSSHDKLRKLTSNSDGKIEKGLMKNMLLAYFNTSEHKRSDVVAVLGHILNFTEEEIKKVGTGSQPPQTSGWFSGLLSYSPTKIQQQQQQQHDKTFTELFVSFLEKESDNKLISQPASQLQTSGVLPSSAGPQGTSTVTAIPSRLRDSPLPMSPLASSTPVANERLSASVSTSILTNPLLMNARSNENAQTGRSGTGPGDVNNALLGSRPSLDLPTITKSSSSSTALRQILFDN